MSTRLAVKAKEAFMQYSKKMCTRVTIFWMIYRIVVSLLVFFRPETATAMTRLTEGVDTIMIVNMSTYTANSSTEKLAIAFSTRKGAYSSNNEEATNKDDDDKNNEEEQDNG